MKTYLQHVMNDAPKKVLLMLAGVAATLPLLAAAQSPRYPTRPVRMVVALAPGGSTDIVARIVAQKYSEAFGKTFVVDNRPGAGATLGSDLIAKATPDGHNLLFASASLAATVPLYPKLPYNPVKDFAPIGIVGQSFYVVLVQPSLGVKTLKELIAAAKAKPRYIQYASAGQGTITHMTVELFMMNAGIKMQDIPFKGGAPALAAFLGGQMPVIFSPIAECLPHLKAGAKVTPLAVTLDKRSPDLPDVPTLEEAGVPDSAVMSRTALLAPAGTPQDIVRALNAELNKMLATADVRARLKGHGLVAVGGTPAELHEYLKSEIARWTKVVKVAGIALK
jgi:tripartite-type tricarboxylate transporter receptor subunit TctC